MAVFADPSFQEGNGPEAYPQTGCTKCMTIAGSRKLSVETVERNNTMASLPYINNRKASNLEQRTATHHAQHDDLM
jgi:hypothetical protein